MLYVFKNGTLVAANAAEAAEALAAIGAAATSHTHTPAAIGAAAASHTHTAVEVGAAAAGHTHTAAEVGAAAASHTHTPAAIGAAAAGHTHAAADVGAAAAGHTHTAAEVGAAAAGHTHTPASIGAAAASHTHPYLTQVDGDARYITQATGDARYTRDIIPYATVGDSIATVADASLTLQDWRTPASGYGLLPDKYASQISMQSGGWLRLVANCGIGGQTTADLLLRDTGQTASATRRSIVDAANLGAKRAFISIGINDIQQSIYSTTTAAARDAWLAGTLYPNITQILRRVRATGMEPYFLSLTGYDFGAFAAAYPAMFPNGAADVVARRTVIALVNAYVRDTILPALGFGQYIDLSGAMVNADGSWKAGMSIDGLHPSKLGSQTGAGVIVTAIFGGTQDPRTVRNLYQPGGTASANIFSNPTMEKTGGNGAAGALAVYAPGGGGTATVTNSVVLAYDRYWHSTKVVPLTADATYGTTGIMVDFDLPIYGATPAVSFAAGDLLGIEAVMFVDSGTEGVAPEDLISIAGRGRVWYAAGASSYYVDCCIYDLTVANQVTLPGVQKVKLTIPAIKVPDVSANLTACKFSVFAFARNLKPFRLLVSGINAVKLPAGF